METKDTFGKNKKKEKRRKKTNTKDTKDTNPIDLLNTHPKEFITKFVEKLETLSLSEITKCDEEINKSILLQAFQFLKDFPNQDLDIDNLKLIIPTIEAILNACDISLRKIQLLSEWISAEICLNDIQQSIIYAQAQPGEYLYEESIVLKLELIEWIAGRVNQNSQDKNLNLARSAEKLYTDIRSIITSLLPGTNCFENFEKFSSPNYQKLHKLFLLIRIGTPLLITYKECRESLDLSYPFQQALQGTINLYEICIEHLYEEDLNYLSINLKLFIKLIGRIEDELLDEYFENYNSYFPNKFIYFKDSEMKLFRLLDFDLVKQDFNINSNTPTKLWYQLIKHLKIPKYTIENAKFVIFCPDIIPILNFIKNVLLRNGFFKKGYEEWAKLDKKLSYIEYNSSTIKEIKDVSTKLKQFIQDESGELLSNWTRSSLIDILTIIERDIGGISKKIKIRIGLQQHSSTTEQSQKSSTSLTAREVQRGYEFLTGEDNSIDKTKQNIEDELPPSYEDIYHLC